MASAEDNCEHQLYVPDFTSPHTVPEVSMEIQLSCFESICNPVFHMSTAILPFSAPANVIIMQWIYLIKPVECLLLTYLHRKVPDDLTVFHVLWD